MFLSKAVVDLRPCWRKSELSVHWAKIESETQCRYQSHPPYKLRNPSAWWCFCLCLGYHWVTGKSADRNGWLSAFYVFVRRAFSWSGKRVTWSVWWLVHVLGLAQDSFSPCGWLTKSKAQQTAVPQWLSWWRLSIRNQDTQQTKSVSRLRLPEAEG